MYDYAYSATVSGDQELPPIYMGLVGEKNKKGRKGQHSGWRLNGRVVDRQKKGLSGIEVAIKSTGPIQKKSGILGKLVKVLTSRNKKQDEESISIKVTTNIAGIFTAGRELPNGSYIIACSDPSGKYKFTSKFLVLKEKIYPSLLFVGYTNEDVEELKKRKEEIGRGRVEKEKAEKEESATKDADATERDQKNVIEDDYKVVGETRSPNNINEPATVTVNQNKGDPAANRDKKASGYVPPKPHQSKSERISEHERLWKAGEEERKRMASSVSHNIESRDIPKDNPQAWKRNAPNTPTVWVSSAGLLNMARAKAEALRFATSPTQGNQQDRRRGRIPRPPTRTTRNASRERHSEEEMMNSLRTALNVVKNIPGYRQVMIIFFVILIVILLYFILFGFGSPAFPIGLGGNGGPSPEGPGGPGGGSESGDIAACMFYRGSALPAAEQYKSYQLISYFEEASQVSGVPSVILAAIARVETPSLTGLTDETLNSYTCPVSPDGAMGPLQVVVHYSARTDAICRDCIAVGAGFLGKTVDELTQSDYCDLKTGLVIGAGFILKKMQYLYGTATPTWNPSWTQSQDAMHRLANSFYGCLGYPSCAAGPYNYGQDVWNSVQQCKPTTGGPTTGANCPIPNGTVTCGSETNAINGCGHCDENYIRDYDPDNRACSFPQTHYAMDIGGADLQDIILPTINGHQIKWVFTYEEYKSSNESIKGFAGEDQQTGDRFYLQLHHVDPGGSPGAEYYSGDTGARICGSGCAKRHVHVEIGTGGTSLSNVTWIDATQFFCKASV